MPNLNYNMFHEDYISFYMGQNPFIIVPVRQSENMLTSQQKSFLFSVISNHSRLVDVLPDIEYYWSSIPTEFRELINQEQYFPDYMEPLLTLFPELRTHIITCQRCQHPTVSSLAFTVRVHEDNDPFAHFHEERWCQHHVFHEWGDGYYHNVREMRLARWHGQNRSVFYKGVDFSNPKLLGLEIETFVKGDVRNVYEIANQAQDLGNVLAEGDGSLDRQHGVEFIFKPFPLDSMTIDGPVGKVTEFLRSNGVLGWDAGRGYGIHISINAKMMSRLHCAKFCYFINRNSDLCEIVGGRPEGRYAEYLSRRLSASALLTDNKYLAAARRSNDRIEVRIFRSSLFWPRIRRNLEFVDSVREYTKISSAKSLNKEGYIEYLKDSGCCKAYRNIRELLGLTGKKQPTRELAMSVD